MLDIPRTRFQISPNAERKYWGFASSCQEVQERNGPFPFSLGIIPEVFRDDFHIPAYRNIASYGGLHLPIVPLRYDRHELSSNALFSAQALSRGMFDSVFNGTCRLRVPIIVYLHIHPTMLWICIDELIKTQASRRPAAHQIIAPSSVLRPPYEVRMEDEGQSTTSTNPVVVLWSSGHTFTLAN
ncbi:hypothetical protein N7457_006147 [Penicillium paradoxum]|uniref:uncharacterized protein n=1 Tax=Penicillium paradoxum TaxID=176176 RepID=UPI002548C467|nr:uncharacterized protein N7457_006147 [Penicillium paradoxum]KAJ5780987.1 hypothetical protein N7457_006147 [Penicillium paradoxum]